MDVMIGLCGLAPDAKKSEDGKRNMLALGHWVRADVARMTVLTRLDEEKTRRWSLAVEEIWKRAGVMRPWPASLVEGLAGR